MVYGIILYYFVLYCTMVLWYYGIMVLWYILFFISFLSAGVAASGNSFSEPVFGKMNVYLLFFKSFLSAGVAASGNSFSEPVSEKNVHCIMVLYGILWYYMVLYGIYIYIYIYIV